ncbi:MAG: hypothetical protein ABI432_02135 [Flavobacteriales bacterium]
MPDYVSDSFEISETDTPVTVTISIDGGTYEAATAWVCSDKSGSIANAGSDHVGEAKDAISHDLIVTTRVVDMDPEREDFGYVCTVRAGDQSRSYARAHRFSGSPDVGQSDSYVTVISFDRKLS